MNTVAVIDTEAFFQRLEEILGRTLKEQLPDKPQGEAMPELFSRRQAAEFLGVSLGTVDNLARAGLLQKHYLGSVPRFRREELVQAFESWKKYQR